MATNPYSYGSLGARWTVGEPTSKSLLDISRVKNDANRWVLEQLLTDPDDSTTGFGLLNGVTATTQTPSDNSTKLATTAYADAAASAASTPPAGANTQIQYNNSGVFGASNNLTFDGTDLAVGNAAPSSYIDSVHGVIVGDTGDATSEIVLASSTTGVSELNFTDTADTTNQGQILYDHTSNFMSFDTAAAEAMRIHSNGDLSIGSTSSGFSTFYVTGDKAGFVSQIHNTNSSTPQGLYMNFSAASPDNNTQQFLQCADSTTTRCRIYSDGDLQNHDNSYGAISDERLKQDIVDASSQWDDIKNLRVRKYKFISDVEAHGADAVAQIGVIAQEAQLVSPGLVQHRVSYAVLDDDGNEVQPAVDQYSVQYSVLYMKCVKALQEAIQRIETLEAQVAALQP